MKKHYVVRASNGFTVCNNKKEAIEILLEDHKATDIIQTQSNDESYYHDNVNIIGKKQQITNYDTNITRSIFVQSN